MPRVVYFEISVNEPEKAANFYKTVFGWKVTKWEGPVEYWLVETGEGDQPGINSGIMRSDEMFSGTVNSVDLPDVDSYIEKIEQNGGLVVVDQHAIPGVGYIAFCRDVEGILFGIHQEDPNASA
jgi:predicted enzyme related to lactoylglutathione lyase